MSRFEHKRGMRSDRYQYLLLETPISNDHLANFKDDKRPSTNSIDIQEMLYDLNEQLRLEFDRICQEELTERQYSIVQLSLDGLTQIEIAKKLGVNQSSITKSLKGNTDYNNGGKTYGGSKKKLTRLIINDPIIQDIMCRIYLHMDNERLFFYQTFRRLFPSSLEFETLMDRLSEVRDAAGG